MRPLVLLIFLAVAGTAAAEEGRPAAVTTQMATPGSGSSMPVEARAPPARQPQALRPTGPEDVGNAGS